MAIRRAQSCGLLYSCVVSAAQCVQWRGAQAGSGGGAQEAG